MTEREHLSWDATQEAVKAAAAAVADLYATLPDGMEATAARNRVVMAMGSLEDARDQLSAARDRMNEQDRAGRIPADT